MLFLLEKFDNLNFWTKKGSKNIKFETIIFKSIKQKNQNKQSKMNENNEQQIKFKTYQQFGATTKLELDPGWIAFFRLLFLFGCVYLKRLKYLRVRFGLVLFSSSLDSFYCRVVFLRLEWGNVIFVLFQSCFSKYQSVNIFRFLCWF